MKNRFMGHFLHCDWRFLDAFRGRLFHANGSWMALPSWWRMFCFGIPSGFIVYGFVAIEVKHGWTFSAPWKRLGDTSYSLYLWHQMLFAALATGCTQLGLVGVVPSELLGVAFVGAAIGLGFLSYHYVELFILDRGAALVRSNLLHKTREQTKL
jgi:peptidoglycan/LPS O-acetylase OafA/YrhL